MKPKSNASRRVSLSSWARSMTSCKGAGKGPMPPSSLRPSTVSEAWPGDRAKIIAVRGRRGTRTSATGFVELGRHLCEVRAGQCWRLENLKSFDEFLGRRFPESRHKAYYLMSIHEHQPQVRRELKEVGWTKGLELAKLARRQGQSFQSATWLYKAR